MVAPKHEYVLDFSNLCGGINLWDPDYRMKSNESPEMKNLLWRNGMLCSRKGQYYLQGRTLRAIGEEIGYDKDYVFQLKRKALSMVQIPESSL